ncbi:MAG: hypothetical protein GC168_10835 [Candidatus Hydrogenedens sp.]|nr:hypothetical protein [Candidatus Hydrogenedens sp.]
MKTANFGLNNKVLGSLQGVAAFTLIAVLALAGAAHAQVVLGDVTVEADAEYTPGENVNVTITIDRSDATADPDDDVTALGGELTLPTGWKLALDADNNCTPVLQSGETGLDNQVANTNARVQIKRSQTTFLDPPTNSVCTPVPETGDVLEFFWLDAQASNPLPVSFPVVLKIVVTSTGNSTGQQQFDLQAKYRVSTGSEQTTDAAPATTEQGVGGCQTVAGDADGSGGVDPADAQLAFDAFLGVQEAVDQLNSECGNFCDPGSSGIDPADAQGIFNQFLGVQDPCNS